jgi:diguanylate cyclase (GGDEF)-like protein
MNLTEFMARQNKPVLVCTGIVLLAAVILLDELSPPGFEASVFYLVPVSFFASFLGRRLGLVVSLICASVAFALHRTDLPSSSSSLAYWNALAWLAVYIFFVYIISEIQSLYARERSWSHTDPLTGIPNRRSFFERLEIEKSRAQRHDLPLTLAYLDLDHFKEVNDRFGHNTGDKLLAIVAHVIKDAIRRADAIARLGGDEFAVLLPDTNSVAATAALDKMRSSLNAAMKQHQWPVTFSIGLVTFQPQPASVQEMISAADNAMYSAKKNGRDRLQVERPAA